MAVLTLHARHVFEASATDIGLMFSLVGLSYAGGGPTETRTCPSQYSVSKEPTLTAERKPGISYTGGSAFSVTSAGCRGTAVATRRQG